MPIAKHTLRVLIFEDNDLGYLRWVEKNDSGYVVNAKRVMARDDDWVVLHKATCSTIKGEPSRGEVWTSGQYLKVCSRSKDLALEWVRRNYVSKAHNCDRCL